LEATESLWFLVLLAWFIWKVVVVLFTDVFKRPRR